MSFSKRKLKPLEPLSCFKNINSKQIRSQKTISSEVSIVEYNSIIGIETLWNSFLPSNHSLFSPNLVALENCQLENMNFKYLMIQKNEELMGLVYLQHLKITEQHFAGSAIDKPGLGWLKKCVKNQFSDVLICGNLFRIYFPGFYFKNDNDQSLIFKILLKYINDVKNDTVFCGMIIKDAPVLTQDDEAYKLYNDDVTMEIDINERWETLYDYRSELSKKYRQRFDKIRLSKSPITTKELSLDEIIENSKQLENLYLNLAQRQTMRIGFINANYFIELKKHHQDAYIIKAYYFQNKMVAFSSMILYAEMNMEIHYIGIDYNYNNTFNLYFNILYDGLETAIEHKMKKLELGRTARIAKASLGAKPVTIKNYIYLKKGIPSMAFKFFNNRFVQNIGNEWEQRQPFKKNVQ